MKQLAKIAFTFSCVLLALYLLLALAAAIPNAALAANTEKSALFYKDKDAFADVGIGQRGIQDNYSDSIMLGVAWNMGVGNPFTSSINTRYNDGGEYGENYGLYISVTENASPNTDYTRYWHGSAAIIRMLLPITDVQGIKTLGFVFALLLLIGNALYLVCKKQVFLAAALPLSLIACGFFGIYFSMEYQPTVIITLLLCPLYLILEKRNDNALVLISTAGGVLTAFFDFLTAETMTVLIPLILVFAVRISEGRMQSAKKAFMLIVKCGAAWIAAYAFTFAAKWIAAYALIGADALSLALSSASARMIGNSSAAAPNLLYGILANLSSLFFCGERVNIAASVGGLIISLLIFGSVLYLFYDKTRASGKTALVLLIGGMVFVRFILLCNHSYMHGFFTFRALAATLLAMLVYLRLSCSFKKKKARRSHV